MALQPSRSISTHHSSAAHTLREEQRLRVFDKRVLRRIFGTKRDELTGG
jgi:hypothetical protein